MTQNNQSNDKSNSSCRSHHSRRRRILTPQLAVHLRGDHAALRALAGARAAQDEDDLEAEGGVFRISFTLFTRFVISFLLLGRARVRPRLALRLLLLGLLLLLRRLALAALAAAAAAPEGASRSASAASSSSSSSWMFSAICQICRMLSSETDAITHGSCIFQENSETLFV